MYVDLITLIIKKKKEKEKEEGRKDEVLSWKCRKTSFFY